LFAVTALSGCSLFRKKEKAADAYDPTMDQTAGTENYPAYPPSGGFSSPTTGGRTHTVQKGDTLYKLARQYYNDQSKWKEIFEANRAELGDPNRVRVGQRLTIP